MEFGGSDRGTGTVFEIASVLRVSICCQAQSPLRPENDEMVSLLLCVSSAPPLKNYAQAFRMAQGE